MTTSVLIPSFKRGPKLRTCLLSLAKQSIQPSEVIVVWQADDSATRDLVESCRSEVSYPLRALHSPTAGVVPAENLALDSASGKIILLIDDDAIAPPDWLARHLAFYESNPECGAVGGPAINFKDGVPMPRRSAEPIGTLTWYGKHHGNMYDHIDAWRSRPPIRAQSLVGYNLSLRRNSLLQFEAGLKSYWQMFELDACLQILANGYEVWFDFSNIVEHHSNNSAYVPGREGDLQIKVYNSAFNNAFILSKFSPWYLRLPRIAYMMGVGHTNSPGVAAAVFAMKKYGNPLRELKILGLTWCHEVAGWRAGKRERRNRMKRVSPPTTAT